MNMTIKDLIDELKKYPQNANFFINIGSVRSLNNEIVDSEYGLIRFRGDGKKLCIIDILLQDYSLRSTALHKNINRKYHLNIFKE